MRLTRPEIQQQLDQVYEDFRQEVRTLDLTAPNDYSAPLLISIPERWMTSRFRMMVFGRETRGWGLNYRYSQDRRSGLETLSDFLAAEDAVPTLKQCYEAFDLGRDISDPAHPVRMEGGYPVTRSQFWRAFHLLMQRLEGNENPQAALHSNFTICDYSGQGQPPGSNLVSQRFFDAQMRVLRRQIEVIRPGVAVFMMGGKYSHQFEETFQGLSNCWDKAQNPRFWVSTSPPWPLPCKTVWSSHPRAWRKQTQVVVDELADWISM